MSRPLVLAIDIGGTKIAAGLVDEAGTMVARVQSATAARGKAGQTKSAAGDTDRGEALFVALVTMLDDLGWRDRAPVACGVGWGGPMVRDGETVSPVNIGAWRAFPLRSRLIDALGLPVFVDNDAKALALAEGWLGAARGVRDFVAMVVSTGVGGGIVLDGRLLDGGLGNAGHIGHITVEPDGHLCGCGARGCLEAEASGTAIAHITGRPAAEADPDTIVRVGTYVGRAVAAVANLLDLRLAVVAGSVALGFGDPFFAAAQVELDARARLDFSVGAEVRRAGLEGDGPLLGCAAVGWRGLGRPVGVG